MGTHKKSPVKVAQPRTRDGPDLGPHGVMGCHHDISINRMTEPNVLPPLPSGAEVEDGGVETGQAILAAQEHAYRVLSIVKVTEQKVRKSKLGKFSKSRGHGMLDFMSHGKWKKLCEVHGA